MQDLLKAKKITKFAIFLTFSRQLFLNSTLWLLVSDIFFFLRRINKSWFDIIKYVNKYSKNKILTFTFFDRWTGFV